MIEWWGNSIWEYYAATEGGGTVVDAQSWSVHGTVGKAWPGAEIKIINDDGTEAETDNQGTVFMKLVKQQNLSTRVIKQRQKKNG